MGIRNIGAVRFRLAICAVECCQAALAADDFHSYSFASSAVWSALDGAYDDLDSVDDLANLDRAVEDALEPEDGVFKDRDEMAETYDVVAEDPTTWTTVLDELLDDLRLAASAA